MCILHLENNSIYIFIYTNKKGNSAKYWGHRRIILWETQGGWIQDIYSLFWSRFPNICNCTGSENKHGLLRCFSLVLAPISFHLLDSFVKLIVLILKLSLLLNFGQLFICTDIGARKSGQPCNQKKWKYVQMKLEQIIFTTYSLYSSFFSFSVLYVV